MFSQATNSVLEWVGTVSADIFALLAFLLILIAAGLAKGKDLLIVFIIALYPSALFTAHFPFYDYVHQLPVSLSIPVAELLVFLLVLGTSMFILAGYIDTGYQEHAFWRYVELTTLAIAGVVLTISIFYHIIEFQYLYNFSSVVDAVFASEKYFFFWLIAPFVIIPSFVRP